MTQRGSIPRAWLIVGLTTLVSIAGLQPHVLAAQKGMTFTAVVPERSSKPKTHAVAGEIVTFADRAALKLPVNNRTGQNAVYRISVLDIKSGNSQVTAPFRLAARFGTVKTVIFDVRNPLANNHRICVEYKSGKNRWQRRSCFVYRVVRLAR